MFCEPDFKLRAEKQGKSCAGSLHACKFGENFPNSGPHILTDGDSNLFRQSRGGAEGIRVDKLCPFGKPA